MTLTLSMPLTIRPATDDDLATMLAIRNACYPEHIETIEDWRHWRENFPASHIWQAMIAERDGRPVGYAHFLHAVGMYHPRKLYVSVNVLPEARRHGIGGRLYDAAMAGLAPIDPLVLRCEAREDMAESLAFIERRGYVEEMRFWESRLDVAGFDPAPFAGAERRALAGGVTISSLAEFMASDPDHRRKLYKAVTTMVADVPMPDAYTPRPFEDWEQALFSDANLLPEGYFLALDRGEVVAVSQLWRGAEADVLYTGLTATRRDYRRRGLALALKLRALGFAQAQGAREIRTHNETRNWPMLSINEALGFVKQPVWISYALTLKAA